MSYETALDMEAENRRLRELVLAARDYIDCTSLTEVYGKEARLRAALEQFKEVR